MLEARDLNAWYGDSHILHGVSMSITTGERVSLLGRNGAGKSTFLKSLMNAEPRISGTVSWLDSDISALPAFRRARLGIALVPEDRRIYPHLTVIENIEMARHNAHGGSPLGVDDIIRRFPMLEKLTDRMGDQLSGGQQQMLAIARALAASPRLMLLDEPTEGLAPVIVEQLADDVVSACEELGAGLLLCEQNLWFARKCTSSVHVIDSGRIVFSGSWTKFDADDEIKTRYLAV